MKNNAYRTERIPPMRRFAMDAGYLGRRRHIVHGLIEVDVTDARELIREHERIAGERLSFTAFIIHSLSRAIEEHPHLHAYRDWRGRLVIFEDVNITSMLEVQFGARKIPIPHVFKSTNRKTLSQIHEEMRAIQKRPHATAESRFMRWFLLAPAFIRRAFYWIVMKFPSSFRDDSSSVIVTAVGMFGEGGGWAITMPNFTLSIAVGGIAMKPGIHEGEIAVREYLDLTLSIDHDIVDGAPAARFIQTFRSLLETSYGLRDIEASNSLAI
ncbi:MAG: 2-oxo acid dehydrogenase subunit E2 [Chloroflexi bacterium]|nr:2-oxo acid dehydrogenase subunit E2 [Chloroflexota bacterium]